MTTAIYTHEDCLNHVTPPGYPERVDRLKVLNKTLSVSEFDALVRREAPMGSEEDVTLCHPQSHIDRMRDSVPAEGFKRLDADTQISPGSFTAAMRAVGGNIAAVDAVLEGEVGNAFVCCRPPGHHAEFEVAMGFCLFGNVAIGAKHALERRGLSRVAIVDFDVHHGNGTQALLWDEARSLFCSSHQVPLYPGSGAIHERGAHDNVVNLPLEPGSTGAIMRIGYERDIFPRIDAFKPELIFISAGFDAHVNDPLANLLWEAEDFAWLTEQICDLADKHCGGRVVSTLEGGYDLDGLAVSCAAHVKVLMERGG